MLFNRTSVREELRPRKFTEARPSVACERLSNWFVSPKTPSDTDSSFMSSTGDGSPRFLRSSSDKTSTGSAAFSGVPLMTEPVTTMTSPSFAFGSAASAGPIDPAINAASPTLA